MKAVLSSDRIVLRPPRLSDVGIISRYCAEPALGRYMPNLPFPYHRRHALWFVRRSWREEKKFNQFTRAIALVESDELVGMISFHNVDFKNKKCEVGYWIAKPNWNRGLAAEALKLWLGFGFKRLNLRRIYARVFHPNQASSRVLLKCGFKYEGTLRKSEFHRRRWLDEHYYGILKEEYQKIH